MIDGILGRLAKVPEKEKSVLSFKWLSEGLICEHASAKRAVPGPNALIAKNLSHVLKVQGLELGSV
jgi:hypothetical protein